MSTIAGNIAQVEARIRAAAEAVQRDVTSIHLLAVSKTKPAAALREAYAAGIRDFGENYLQEARAKQVELTDLPLSWHFIGPIQSNKTREIAEHFAWVHSVDRLKIAQRLSEQRPADLPPLNICIQVNVSGEASQSGCNPADLPALAAAISALPRLKLRDLSAVVADIAGQTLSPESIARLLATVGRQLALGITAGMGLGFAMSQDPDLHGVVPSPLAPCPSLRANATRST